MPNSDIARRLEKCFGAVFPEGPAAIQWDSMSTVTLVAVVNEEFGCELELDQMESLNTFEALLGHLEARAHA